MKHKIQIWLRKDQAELVAESLKIIRGQLVRESRPAFETLAMAATFTANRIDEVLAMVEKPNTQAEGRASRTLPRIVGGSK